MAFLFLMAVSAGLALGGVVSVWLGFDDRSPAVITAGVVAIASGAIVVALGLLLRELQVSRRAIVTALAARPDDGIEEISLIRPPLAPRAAENPPAISDALAAVAAELGDEPAKPAQSGVARAAEPSADRMAPAAVTQAPPPFERTPVPERPAVLDRPTSRPFVLPPRPPVLAPATPAPSEPLAPAALAPTIGPRVAPNPPANPTFAAPIPAEKPPAPLEPVLDAAASPAKPEEASSAPATPPDIDTILNEIISRRDRPSAAPGPRRAEPPAPTLSIVRPMGELAKPEPASPTSAELDARDASDRDDADGPEPTARESAANRPADQESGKTHVAAADRALDRTAEDDAPTPSIVSGSTPLIPISSIATTGSKAEDERNADENARAPLVNADEPEQKVAARNDDERSGETTIVAKTEELAAAGESETLVEDEPASGKSEEQLDAAAASSEETPSAPQRKLVRSFSSGPNRYTMYDDGSIEAETPTGRLTFASFDELRRYIDERMNQRAAGA